MDRKTAKQKAAALVAQMTLHERVAQLSYDAPAIPRLNVPAYNWWNEGLHGVARAGTATMFPQAIGMAASFNAPLLREVGNVVAQEGRAKYNASAALNDRDIYKGLTFWSPNVNIFRDPRWGRGQETYGEDPCLTSRLGVAYTQGLQGEGEVLKSAACAKHFAVHSGPEADRHHFNATASPKDMAETYLPAFEALVKEAKVEAVMGAYNRLNGEPCCGDSWLLTTLLREEWGFEGHVVSDAWALKDMHENHKVTSTGEESSAKALKAGCDLNCGASYGSYLLSALEQKLVDEADITRAAIALFTTRYMLGMFEGSAFDAIAYTEVESAPHLALAEETAAQSMVLLKNDGLLPLDKTKLQTIGVVGPNANSRAALIGNYHGTASEYVTVLDGIRRHVGTDARILYAQGCALNADRVEPLARAGDRLSEAITVAALSDVVVLVLGLNETLEGEEGDAGNSYASGDKPDLQLPQSQRTLMEAMAKTAKPVVLCMMTGSAMDLSYAQRHFSAILQLWYPGASGGSAAARLLFGQQSPSGKLPVTFYSSLAALPDFTDYTMAGRTYRYLTQPPLYPFGYGLSYGDARVVKATARRQGGGATLTALVENRGWATGDVLQAYLEVLDAPHAPAHPALCAFARLELAAGETQEVSLSIPPRAFQVVGDDGNWLTEGSGYRLHVGFHQPDARSAELAGTGTVMVEFPAGD